MVYSDQREGSLQVREITEERENGEGVRDKEREERKGEEWEDIRAGGKGGSLYLGHSPEEALR